jgi:hypothetical protein
MDHEALSEMISLFLKINPEPSDQQFHALAEACGVDKEELESVAYAMLGEAEDILEDEDGPMIAKINANARLTAADAQDTLDDPTVDPDDLPLTDVALNDGDPTDDDLGMQEETLDDGFSVEDVGVGITNNANDVLTDDGVPDLTLGQ